MEGRWPRRQNGRKEQRKKQEEKGEEGMRQGEAEVGEVKEVGEAGVREEVGVVVME